MEIKELSRTYTVKKLESRDIPEILHLCSENRLYYRYCPPMVTAKSIEKDMHALPPGSCMEDKYYLGFYEDGTFLAVMDLICGYPRPEIAYIGFFMTNTAIQRKGIGSQIISELCDALQRKGFSTIRLAWVKGNPQAEHFWLRNGFAAIKETTSNAADCVILAERMLE